MYQIDMKFDRQLRQQTSWVVSYGGTTIPRWLTPAILKIVISPLSDLRIIRFWWNFVHSSRFWTAWMSRYQKRKSCTGQTTSSTERISCFPELLSVSVRPYNPVHSVFCTCSAFDFVSSFNMCENKWWRRFMMASWIRMADTLNTFHYLSVL